MAEGVFRRMLKDAGIDNVVSTDSAGTHAYHVGSPPDRRGIEVAKRRGVDLEHLRARRVVAEDFSNFHYVLAMDHENYRHLVDMCTTADQRRKVSLFLNFSRNIHTQEVPDPYYGPPDGFERVMELLEEGMQELLLHVRRRHRL